MAWLTAFIFTLICSVIKGQGTGNIITGIGWAKGSFLDETVKVEVQVKTGDVDGEEGVQVAEIRMCGPSGAWFGVGYGATTMANAYTIVAWKSSTASNTTVNVNEYKLGASSVGEAVDKRGDTSVGTTKFQQTGSGEEDGVLCVTAIRKAVADGALYNFPNTFSTTPEDVNVIVATGAQLDWLTATAMGNRETGDTLKFTEGNLPTPSPTEPQSDAGANDDIQDSSGICFSSDSYALTWPNFEKKKVSDLEIYDKILTYNELDDTYFWDELLVKIHFEEGEFLNDVMIPMREFILNNGETLTMTGNHLLYIGESGLHPADEVRIGDKLKVFNGSYVEVIGVNEDVMRYPRNMITYNGNLVINGVAISTFTDTIWGESKYWGKSLRTVMKYGYSYNIWRYTAYYVAKLWTEYASFDFKEYVLKFYFVEHPKNDIGKSVWFSSVFTFS